MPVLLNVMMLMAGRERVEKLAEERAQSSLRPEARPMQPSTWSLASSPGVLQRRLASLRPSLPKART